MTGGQSGVWKLRSINGSVGAYGDAVGASGNPFANASRK